MRLKNYVYLLLFFVLFSHNLNAQNFPHKYVKYSLEEGLVNYNTYKILIDSKGILWAGTSNGISQYNGYEFTNYTTANGLEDNYIIDLQEDKSGKIWYLSYYGHLGYIYKDKAYSFPYNDYLLKKRENQIPTSFYVSDNYSIYIGYRRANPLYINKTQGIKELDKPKGKMYVYAFEDEFIFGTNTKNQKTLNNLSIIDKNDKEHYYQFDSLTNPGFLCVKKINDSLSIISFKYDIAIFNNWELIEFHNNVFQDFITSIYVDEQEKIWFSTIFSGIQKYNSYLDIGKKQADVYFPEISCADITQDRQKNYWFSFVGKGLYAVPSFDINILTKDDGITEESINSICKHNNKIIFSADYGKLFSFHNNEIKEIQLRNHQNKIQRLYFLLTDKNDYSYAAVVIDNEQKVIIVKDFEIVKIINVSNVISELFFDINKKNVLVLTTHDIYKINTSDFSTEIIIHLPSKIGAIGETDKGLLIRTENELLLYNNDSIRKIKLPFEGQINNIVQSKDALWFTIQNKGLIITNTDTTIFISAQKELNTKNIHYLKPYKANTMWLATSNGFRCIKFDPLSKEYRSIKITAENGLYGNIVSDFFVKDSILYITSNKGISYFHIKNLTQNDDAPVVHIESITINNEKPQNTEQKLELEHYQNYLHINYFAVSLLNANNIIYRYQLKGLSENWFYTTNTDIQYPSLNPGKYEFIIQAANKDGKWGNASSLNFIIHEAFWRTPAFYISVLLFIAFIVWLSIHLRIKFIRKTNELQQKLYLSEKKALAAQMNPHFIFNSLGSIQKFLLENDSNKADYYLSKFAQLIRLILSSSRKNQITIDDEVRLLKLYLDLEKRRMDNTFTYEFIIDNNLQKESTYIAPMLIQPLLENAIWHGIAQLTERKGHIRIQFGLIDEYITIFIEDNGVGFGSKEKRTNDNEKGDGLSIINDRIEIMKKIHKNKDISIHFENLSDMYGQIEGVLVVITLYIKNI